MSHRKRERPVERLRSALTSVADLEETLAGMFAPTPDKEHAPPNQGSSLQGDQATSSNIGAPELGTPDLTAPTLASGVLSEESTDPSTQQSTLGAPELGAPISGAADLQTRAAIGTTEPAQAHEQNSFTDPNIGAPELSAPDFDVEVFAYRRSRQVLREAITAQDGHTHGEQALFATLWRLAKPVGKGSLRALNIGERTLAAEVPMAYSTTQENTRSLVRKLAIEFQSSGPNRPKTYFVYSYEEILKRRRAAGLTHVLRRTSGVSLVNPSAPTSGAPIPGPPTLTVGAPNLSNSGAPNLNAHIRNSKEHLGTTTTTAPSVIANAIINTFGFVDDQAILTIVRECRRRAPDATDDEIAEIASWQCRRISRLRNVDNPVGLLISQVPRCFEGEPFARYRRERIEAAKRFEDQIDQQP